MLLRYAVSNHPSPHQSTELVERWTDYLDIWKTKLTLLLIKQNGRPTIRLIARAGERDKDG